jgi:hypothetical protein
MKMVAAGTIIHPRNQEFIVVEPASANRTESRTFFVKAAIAAQNVRKPVFSGKRRKNDGFYQFPRKEYH